MFLSNIKKAAKSTFGSGGPSKVNADTLKHILCSKFFKIEGERLANEIASLTKYLCTEKVDNAKTCILQACRLVPLKKEDNGLRPIGIGECVRRIMGK